MTLSYRCVLEIQTVTLSRSCLAVSQYVFMYRSQDVGETDDIMVDALYQEQQYGGSRFKEPGCGWR